jgi:hypothetical protein
MKWPGAAPWFAMALLAGLLGLVGIAALGAGLALPLRLAVQHYLMLPGFAFLGALTAASLA